MTSAERPRKQPGGPEIQADFYVCSICGQRQSQPGELLSQVLKRFFPNHNNIKHGGEGRLVRPLIERQEIVAPLPARRGRQNKFPPTK